MQILYQFQKGKSSRKSVIFHIFQRGKLYSFNNGTILCRYEKHHKNEMEKRLTIVVSFFIMTEENSCRAET